MDNLQHTHSLRRTIKVLIACIKAMRRQKTIDDTLHQERKKELLHAVSVANRRIKKLEQQVINYRSDKQLIHLQEIVKNHGKIILKQTKKINQYELEKL